ncbi:MAG: ABC transporter substrate-binding protein [Candidatus Marinimicrobia bacterium]|nr:ABC transporter substrate-binding protein [Candidatus Neomarinimicrobiota bacterium]
MRFKCAGTLLAALLLFSYTGCDSNSKKDRGDELVFWHSFVAATHPALQQMINRFHKENPGIRIRHQYVPTGDALVQKLITAIASGTAPDIAWIHADFLSKLVETDAIYPIDVFLTGQDSLELLDFFPALLEGGRWGNRLYALPMEATSLALVYNRDLFRQAGLNPEHPPSTWTELQNYSKRLTIDTDKDGRIDQFGFYIPNFPASGNLSVWMNLQFQPFVWQAGGTIADSAGDQVIFNSPAGVEALTLWKELFDELDMRAFSLAHDLGFTSQNLAMVMDGPWNLPSYRNMAGVDWAVAPLPAGSDGRATYLAGEYLTIFKQSDNPQRAWEFVEWFTSPEEQARFSMLSGYLPVRKSTLEIAEYRQFLNDNPDLKSFIDQIPHARGRRMFDYFNTEINQALAEAIEKVLVGNADPYSALTVAADKCNALLISKRRN